MSTSRLGYMPSDALACHACGLWFRGRDVYAGEVCPRCETPRAEHPRMIAVAQNGEEEPKTLELKVSGSLLTAYVKRVWVGPTKGIGDVAAVLPDLTVRDLHDILEGKARIESDGEGFRVVR